MKKVFFLTVFLSIFLMSVKSYAYDVPVTDITGKTYIIYLTYQTGANAYSHWKFEYDDVIPVIYIQPRGDRYPDQYTISAVYLHSDYSMGSWVQNHGRYWIKNDNSPDLPVFNTNPNGNNYGIGQYVNSAYLSSVNCSVALYNEPASNLTYKSVFQDVSKDLSYTGSISYWYNYKGNYYDKVESYSPSLYSPNVSLFSVDLVQKSVPDNLEPGLVRTQYTFTIEGESTYNLSDYYFEIWLDEGRNYTGYNQLTLLEREKVSSIYDSMYNYYNGFTDVYGPFSSHPFSNFLQLQQLNANIKLLLRLSVNTGDNTTLVSDFEYIEFNADNLTYSINNNNFISNTVYPPIKDVINNSFDSNYNPDSPPEIITPTDQVIQKPNNGIQWGDTYQIMDFNLDQFIRNGGGLANLSNSLRDMMSFVPVFYFQILGVGLAAFVTIGIFKNLT